MRWWLLVLMLAGTAVAGAPLPSDGATAAPSDILIVSGTLSDPQGRGVKDVELQLFPNGTPVALPEAARDCSPVS